MQDCSVYSVAQHTSGNIPARCATGRRCCSLRHQNRPGTPHEIKPPPPPPAHADKLYLYWLLLCWCVQVGFEEELLLERYGAAYQDYQKSVKKFIPFLY